MRRYSKVSSRQTLKTSDTKGREVNNLGRCDNAAESASTDLDGTTDRTGQSRERTSAEVAPRIASNDALPLLDHDWRLVGRWERYDSNEANVPCGAEDYAAILRENTATVDESASTQGAVVHIAEAGRHWIPVRACKARR